MCGLPGNCFTALLAQAATDLAGPDLHRALQAITNSVLSREFLSSRTGSDEAAARANATAPTCQNIQHSLGTASADALIRLCHEHTASIQPQLAAWDELHGAVVAAHTDMQRLCEQLQGTQSSADGFMAQAAELSSRRTCKQVQPSMNHPRVLLPPHVLF